MRICAEVVVEQSCLLLVSYLSILKGGKHFLAPFSLFLNRSWDFPGRVLSDDGPAAVPRLGEGAESKDFVLLVSIPGNGLCL